MEEVFDVLTPEGDYTDKTASRDDCHEKGYYHRGVVVFIVSPDGEHILLQQRSAKKKLWPNLWDVSAGGHVNAGEFGFQAAIREAEEEIGLKLKPNDLICIGTNTSFNSSPGMSDHHFNEYFVTHRELDPNKMSLQTDEVQAVRWFTPDEIENELENGTEKLVPKTGCWERILRYTKNAKKH